jgi:hypothetical protein
MSRLATAILFAVTLTCGTGAFFITRLMAQSQSEPASSWLENEPADTLAIEDEFNRNRKLLVEDIKAQRTRLSALFRDPDSTNDQIRQQTQSVIAAQRTLMLSVADHLTTMRNILSPSQKNHLMRLCADTSRGPIRRQRRHGAPQATCTNGNGNGNGFMQKRRMLMNNTNSCGPKMLRLASKLQLTDEQLIMITEQNPQFEFNCRSNCADLAKKRADMLALFEDQNSTDAQITSAIDELTQIHSQIELSITEYLILLRPTLTDGQRNSLGTLCSNCPNI